MAGLSNLIFVVLALVSFISISANVVFYTVTFVACVPNSTCPTGNPTFYNMTFALNGTLSPNLNLKVNDQLQFTLATNVPIHPLTICQNSSSPQFCQGAATSNQLNTPITTIGSNTSASFTAAGTYYYGCLNHPGMGATITVTSAGCQLSAAFFLIVTIALHTMTFI
jgi:hypothetical protein